MTVALTGCTVGPNYKRPRCLAPPQFRAGEEQPTQTSLGDVKWFDLFQDEILRDLIKEALKANYDIRIAAQRVLEAEGQLSATRSVLAPADEPADRRRTHRCSIRHSVERSGLRSRLMGDRPVRQAAAGDARPRALSCWRPRRTRKR